MVFQVPFCLHVTLCSHVNITCLSLNNLSRQETGNNSCVDSHQSSKSYQRFPNPLPAMSESLQWDENGAWGWRAEMWRTQTFHQLWGQLPGCPWGRQRSPGQQFRGLWLREHPMWQWLIAIRIFPRSLRVPAQPPLCLAELLPPCQLLPPDRKCRERSYCLRFPRHSNKPFKNAFLRFHSRTKKSTH